MQAPRVLRPLGLLEIVDQTFRLYRANFWLLVGLAGTVCLPMGLLQGIPDIGLFAAAAFVLVGFPVAGGATVRAMSDCYLGSPVTFEQSYRGVVPQLPRIYLTALVVYLLYLLPVAVPAVPAVLGFMRMLPAMEGGAGGSGLAMIGAVAALLGVAALLVATFAWPWVPFSLTACIVEGKSHFRAVRRAHHLLLPWTWAVVLLVTVILYLLTMLLSSALTVPVQIVLLATDQGALVGEHWSPLLLVNGLLIGVARAITFPLSVGAYVLLYYDAMIRKEGYDLQLLAQGLAASVPPEPPSLPAAETPPAHE